VTPAYASRRSRKCRTPADDRGRPDHHHGSHREGVALPIGLGLVWLLAVQNLLASIAAPLLDWVAQLQKALPGPNAGAFGASAPGVDPIVGSGQATAVLAGYLIAFGVLGGWLLHRRDIA